MEKDFDPSSHEHALKYLEEHGMSLERTTVGLNAVWAMIWKPGSMTLVAGKYPKKVAEISAALFGKLWEARAFHSPGACRDVACAYAVRLHEAEREAALARAEVNGCELGERKITQVEQDLSREIHSLAKQVDRRAMALHKLRQECSSHIFFCDKCVICMRTKEELRKSAFNGAGLP